MFDASNILTQELLTCLQYGKINPWTKRLQQPLETVLHQRRHGKLSEWEQALQQLPDVIPSQHVLNSSRITVGAENDLDSDVHNQFYQLLKETFHPWRKGPYELFGIHIDTEWRSDWKWQRLQHHITPLEGRTVLDVGCGNGYHLWRMLGEGAACAIGADPSQFFMMQFQLVKTLLEQTGEKYPAFYLPLKSEELPGFEDELHRHGFDTVFSMGVLYHRRSPFHHLQELKSFLRPGGELVLETLVIDGDEQAILVPEDRYAKMRNVWSIPSVALLERLLAKTGFVEIRTVDVTTTSLQEQRTTEWMRFESLADFLDPEDVSKTIEEYPAPKRAVVVCRVGY